jgi:hypothetical protein
LGWSAAPIALLAIYSKGSVSIGELEDSLEIHMSRGRNMSPILTKLSKEGIINCAPHYWGK